MFILLFFPTGQKEYASAAGDYYEDNNCDAFFEPVVNLSDYLDVLHEHNPRTTILFPCSQKMKEDGTATPLNTRSRHGRVKLFCVCWAYWLLSTPTSQGDSNKTNNKENLPSFPLSRAPMCILRLPSSGVDRIIIIGYPRLYRSGQGLLQSRPRCAGCSRY